MLAQRPYFLLLKVMFPRPRNLAYDALNFTATHCGRQPECEQFDFRRPLKGKLGQDGVVPEEAGWHLPVSCD